MLNRTCDPPIGPIGLIKILEASSYEILLFHKQKQLYAILIKP